MSCGAILIRDEDSVALGCPLSRSMTSTVLNLPWSSGTSSREVFHSKAFRPASPENQHTGISTESSGSGCGSGIDPGTGSNIKNTAVLGLGERVE